MGKILLKFLRAEIGVVMSIVSYAIYWIAFRSPLRDFLVLFVLAGMALYVSDRKGFLDRRRRDKNSAVGLIFLSMVLMVKDMILGGIALSLATWRYREQDVYPVRTWEESIYVFSFLSFVGLVLLFNCLLFFDGLAATLDISDRPLPSKPRIDLEEASKKYPRDLFVRYAEEYPHNPEGVLEWHIHKKMKEGKTREQAIKELDKGNE